MVINECDFPGITAAIRNYNAHIRCGIKPRVYVNYETHEVWEREFPETYSDPNIWEITRFVTGQTEKLGRTGTPLRRIEAKVIVDAIEMTVALVNYVYGEERQLEIWWR